MCANRIHRLMDSFFFRLLALGFACFVVSGFALATVSNPAVGSFATADQQSPLVSVPQISGDRTLEVSCYGSGSPVVFLLGGYGGGIRDWVDVQPELAKFTRVCAYNRAGIGESSSPLLVPQSASTIATDLHTLIATLGIQEPIILVGFSVGGLIATYYTTMHPEQVAAIALIDPTPPVWPLTQVLRWSGRTRQIEFEKLSGFVETEPERLDMLRVGYETIALEPPSIPVAMVTSGIKSLNPGFEGDHLERILTKLQDDLARDLGATHIVAEHCTHQIPTECPEMVISLVSALTER